MSTGNDGGWVPCEDNNAPSIGKISVGLLNIICVSSEHGLFPPSMS